ncbi:unnamed protein product, partial [Urochloa humidicola]
ERAEPVDAEGGLLIYSRDDSTRAVEREGGTGAPSPPPASPLLLSAAGLASAPPRRRRLT